MSGRGRIGVRLVALATLLCAAWGAAACGGDDRVRELEADLARVQRQIASEERGARAAEAATAAATNPTRTTAALMRDLREQEAEVEALQGELDRASSALAAARARIELLANLPEPPPPPEPLPAPEQPAEPPEPEPDPEPADAAAPASEAALAALALSAADLGPEATLADERYEVNLEAGLAELLRRFEGAAIGPGGSRPAALAISTVAYSDWLRAQTVLATARPFLEENGQTSFEFALATATGTEVEGLTLLTAEEIPFMAGDGALVWTMTGESAAGPVSALFGMVVVGRLAGAVSLVGPVTLLGGEGEVALGDVLSLMGWIVERLREAQVELREGAPAP